MTYDADDGELKETLSLAPDSAGVFGFERYIRNAFLSDHSLFLCEVVMKNRHSLKFTLSATSIVFGGLISPVNGAPKSWFPPSPSNDRDWSLGINWSPVSAPIVGDDIIIGNPLTGTFNSRHFVSRGSSTVTLLDAGTLSLQSVSVGALESSDTLGANRTLRLGRNIAAASVISMTDGPSNTFFLGGQFSSTGLLTINLDYSGQRAVSVSTGKLLRFSGFVNGSGGMVLNGGGTAEFGLSASSGGNNSFLGGITVNSGRLSVVSGGAGPGSGPLGAGIVTLNGGSLTGVPTLPMIFNDVSVTASSTMHTVNYRGTATFTGGQVLTVSDAGRISGQFQGGGSIVKSGTGVLSLASRQTYSGGFTLAGGTVALETGTNVTDPGSFTSGPFGTGVVTVSGGTINAVVTGVSPPQGQSLLIANAFNVAGSAGFFDTTVAGTTDLGLFLYGPMSLQLGSALNVGAPAGRRQILGLLNAVSGSTGLVKEGAGILQIGTPAKSYTGDTRIRAGTVHLGWEGVANLLPTTTVLRFGSDTTAGTLNLYWFDGDVSGYSSSSQTVAGLTTESALPIRFNNEITNVTTSTPSTNVVAATLTVNTAALQSYDYAGRVSGLISLVKSGAGTQSFSGTLAHTGGTTVTGGRMRFAGAISTTYTGATAVGAGAVLEVAAPFSHASTGTGGAFYRGNVTVAAGGLLDVSSATNAAAGSPNVRVLQAGTLAVGGTPTVKGEVRLATVAYTGTPGTRSFKGRLVDVADLAIDHDGGALGSRVHYGWVDMGNNDMVVRGTSIADGQAKLVKVRSAVRDWYTANGGLPGTRGLGSSLSFYTAEGDFTTLAVYDNTAQGDRPSKTMFDGVNVVPTDVLVKFTYLGDTDIDGDVDSRDLRNILDGINNPTTLSGWNWGDVNYDGVINTVDLGRAQAVINAGKPLLMRGAPGSGAGGEGGLYWSVEEMMDPGFDWSRVGSIGGYEDSFTGDAMELGFGGPLGGGVGVIPEPMGAGVGAVVAAGVMFAKRRRR